MFGLSPWLLLGALATAVACAGGGYYKGHEDGEAQELAKWQKDRDALNAAIETANKEANASAMRYEEWKARQQPKIVYVKQKVNDALKAEPVWRDTPIPDGVRSAIADAASAEVDSAQLNAALPASSAPANENEWRPSERSAFVARWLGRLSGAASSASGSR